MMDLSLPLSGDLSDPKVGIWQIVRTAAVGLITNVAAAPFKMLPGLVGSADEDLSFVSFTAGSAEIEPSMLERLNTLARALKERPGLKLVVTPQVAEADKIKLSEDKLKRDLLGEADLDDEKRYLKRLTKRYQEAMKDAGAPDEETEATDEAGLEKMLARLLPSVELTSEELVVLASARSEAIQDHLNVAEGVAAERLSDQDPITDAGESGVRFDLK